MKININKNIRTLISPSYRLLKPKRQEIEGFKSKTKTYLNSIDSSESEENLKTHLMDLFKSLYHPNYLVEQQNKIDFVIRTGKKGTNAGVLFEAKRSSNKSELITKEDINKKAMYEIVLYFMQERESGNTDIKYLIICSEFEFFIFEAKEFERAFYKNTAFLKDFREWQKGAKTDHTTEFFYKSIAKPFIEQSNVVLEAGHFDIRSFEKELLDDDLKNDKKIIPLFKILSPEHLLKISFANDSNSLNKEFYGELLHIIGLEESKDKGKVLIQRLSEDKRNKASLIENTISKLIREDDFNDLELIHRYGTNNKDRAFSIALELCITWVNRLLFLKLLESQVINYHDGDEKYKFLNKRKIADYDELADLFFGVLALQHDEREEHIQEKFSNVPYLNSSLFDKTNLEKIVGINHLNTFEMPLYGRSVLKNKYKNKKLNTLDYIFEFFDAYDFASEGSEDIQEESKTLINASVLGLIFEKINGYQDGAVFTPGYITTYMSKLVIERAVIQKFAEQYPAWKVADIKELKNYLSDHRSRDDILKFNQIINSIKICDPAVGSGHFLVSCLNEIIAVKSKLGLLSDQDGNRLSEYDIEVDNDEIIVTHASNADLFKYKNINGNIPAQLQKMQKGLFHEKQAIIENCLFGVDVNASSVKICQLRLWIELLKNSYYTESSGYTYLETLPNIDINIKQGNSLLSRYALDQKLSDAFRKDFNVSDYKTLVNDYKNTKDRAKKRRLESEIAKVKARFKKIAADGVDVEIRKMEGILNEIKGQDDLFSDDKNAKKGQKLKIKNAQLELNALKKRKKEWENQQAYLESLEWRFEFPEVLDGDGEFKGFDIVIANPPYIRHEEISDQKPHLKKAFKVFKSSADIYSYFFELGTNIAKKDVGQLIYISSCTFFKTSGGQSLRTFLSDYTTIQQIIDFKDVQIFDGVTTYPSIFLLDKKKASDDHQVRFINLDHNPEGELEDIFTNQSQTMSQKWLSSDKWNLRDEVQQNLLSKIRGKGATIEKLGIKTYRGILTGFNDAFIVDGETKEKLISEDPKSAKIIKPFLEGKDIKKWHAEPRNLSIILFPNGFTSGKIGKVSEVKAWEWLNAEYPALAKYLIKFKEQAKKRYDQGEFWWELRACAYYDAFKKEKLIWAHFQEKPLFIFDDSGFYTNNKCYILPKNDFYLLALFNSKINWFLFKSMTTMVRGGFYEATSQNTENFIVPEASGDTKLRISKLSKEATRLSKSLYLEENKEKRAELKIIEEKIDSEFYSLFDLTKDEIRLIEESAVR